jgi:hypothetical protein
MYIAGLWVRDVESHIFGVLVRLRSEVSVKRKYVAHQVMLKLEYIHPGPFSSQKLPPTIEEIIYRDDTVIAVREHDPTKRFHSELLPLLQRTKTLYLLWFGYYQTLPKPHRHTLGQRIDTLFIEMIEAISAAAFLMREQKLPYVRLAIRKQDTLKLLLMILWEANSLDTTKYVALSAPLEEIGKMLGGWNGQLQKQNSPAGSGEK